MIQKRNTPSLMLAAFLLLTSSIFFTGCKKDSNPDNNTAEDARDSVLAICREVYLWYEVIPSNFNAKSYDTPQDVMAGIRALQPLDRFSFVFTEDEYQQQFVQGEYLSYGMGFKFESNTVLRVSYSLRGSQAYASGVRRGWTITKMNGIDATRPNVDQLNNLLNGTGTISFTFIDNSGQQKNLSLAKESIADDEVMYRSVIESGGKKIGYLVYNSFLTATQNPGTPNEKIVHPGLDESFGYFNAQGVTDLILDLRYNGGGYVSVAEDLVNGVVNQTANGQVMFKYEFNNKLGGPPYNYNETVNVNKAKASNPPSLGNINRLVFIVGQGTASASELVINSLKPYFAESKLVGQTTYGKPVGFSAISTNTTPNYRAFPIMFRTVNKLGTSDYYTGFVPDKAQADLANKDWGDVTEACLNDAIQYVVNGSFPTATRTTEAAMQTSRQMPAIGSEPKFNGMIK